jgi:uncharacterized SAM-binding protein YcdF (DUF218 family)
LATERERFLAVLYTGPLLQSDAIVVLAGEDAAPRLAVAAQLLRDGGAAKILVTGGRHDPPRHVGATACAAQLMGMGIKPACLITDDRPQHTRDQAVAFAASAQQESWGRVLLVASSYHLPRAYLTFVKALAEAEMPDTVHVCPVPTSQTPWFGSPAGVDATRGDLLAVELAKIDEYGAQGHVASYAEGLAYLQHWEGR